MDHTVKILALGMWLSNDDDDDDQQGDDERTESDDDKNIDLNKTDDEEETQKDEFVHTPDDYVPTDDETNDVDDEEYDRINKEMYDDVNVELKDLELADKGKDDEEMTDAEKVNVEHKNVNQEVAGDQVKDDAQATVTASPATQKTKVPLPSSSSLSDYATKFLNFDNIPLADTEIISMMEIKVQHEDLQSTISTTIVHDSTTLTTIHQRASDLEKEVKILKDFNHYSEILTAIKSRVPYVVKEFLGTDLDDTFERVIKKQLAEFIQKHSVPAAVVADAINKQLDSQKSAVSIRKIKMEKAGKQQETKYTITLSHTTELQEFDQKGTLFETMTKTKSFNKNTKHKALYHALIKSIVEDEDAMDKGVTDKKKMSKETKPSKKAKLTGTSKGTTKSQPKSTGKSAQAEEAVFETADTQVPQNLKEDTGNTSEPPSVKAD
ncbi:hypothetical protein Tco_1050352 [Tanacetum coccineum]